MFGGSVWESNPPFQLLAGNTGFEGRAGHQNPMHSQWRYTLILLYFPCYFKHDGLVKIYMLRFAASFVTEEYS
jgi:hypothetical protein